ncbi:hypothetical protein SARC_03978 [Sphaeroforma arctica JP610]|uniref:Hom-end-associated Hint domain-containing protein n=1 Tax=Sphaeroforma arctica JP610 TaxID=667725 RepID=A0A0L0G3W8_9EUKA|nr:hypothetical protein SARC_03978 [Sphaeroforma arctica JP610]KNC83802.1 hypothetical protein SARC_03978 [Sphaeroforma arctica JP610]|eukprot:XP_014157704.1 hypothetical protein SARC_03978 [Sphaeroforma arctica JP610]
MSKTTDTTLDKLHLKEWNPDSISPWKRGDEESMDGSKVLVCGRSGLGKCMAPDTLVKMCSGVLQRIDKVVVGDLLLCPDIRPRRVLNKVRGIDQMYTIHQADSDPYVVTGDHKLVLYNVKTESIVVCTAEKSTTSTVLSYHDGYACKTCSDGTIQYARAPDSGIGGYVRVTKNISAAEPYVGVEVSIDGLYCFADDTVTHNSTI